MELLTKILIANRGEIALRIIRSAKKLGIRTVSIYTASEQEAGFVRLADESVCIGNGPLTSTYLDIDKIIGIAISTGSQAIHPGYGFLSESHAFAKACEENHIIFIGPSSEVLKLMSSKPASKQLAMSLGIPVAFSQKIDLHSPLPDETNLKYPMLIKASYGGGGKGMELVLNNEELKEKIEKSSRMALNYFGNGEIFIEQFIQNARHVEVQILGDNFHNIIHLYERECSIQRNHQKIIEEAPAIFLKEELRDTLLQAAVKIAKAVNYSGAGTVEFLVDERGNIFFMEMNPRIQVEHAVTEEITGIDIVREQLRIASGFPISVSQEELTLKGHAIELRVYAENPAHDFTPSSVVMRSVNLPVHPDLRIESDINDNQSFTNQFDPLIVKIIAFCSDRQSAIYLLREQVKNLNIIGPETNTKYLEAILAHPAYEQNNLSVEFCKDNHRLLIDKYISKIDITQLRYLIAFAIYEAYLQNKDHHNSNSWNYLGYWRAMATSIPLSIDGEKYGVNFKLKNKTNPEFEFEGVRTGFKIINQSANCIDIVIDKKTRRISAIFENQYNVNVSPENRQHIISFPGFLGAYPEVVNGPDNNSKLENGEIQSPLHGKILEINIIENQIINKGDLMMVIEAMKSENRILSPRDAKVKKIAVKVGDQVTDRMPLVFLEDYKNE